jgi:hypothetical protein
MELKQDYNFTNFTIALNESQIALLFNKASDILVWCIRGISVVGSLFNLVTIIILLKKVR